MDEAGERIAGGRDLKGLIATQSTFYTRNQSGRLKRLRQNIVGPRLKSPLILLNLGMSGENDHGQMTIFGVVTKYLTNFIPGDRRHFQIQQDEIRSVLGEEFPEIKGVSHGEDTVAVSGQNVLYHLQHHGIIVQG